MNIDYGNGSFSNNVLGDFAEMNIFNNQYGGDNKAINITYQGEGAQMKATPVSDLTMAGAYEVSDSPANTAKFMGKYGDLNRANQSSYKNSGAGTAQKYINMGKQNQTVNQQALDKQIRTSPLYHQAQSRVEGAFTFGDRYSKKAPKWKDSTPQDQNYGIDPDIKDSIFNKDDD